MSVIVPGAGGGLFDAVATPIDAATWSRVRLMPPAALKVLLVEDEVLIGLHTCDLLHGLGAEKVAFANTMEESLRASRKAGRSTSSSLTPCFRVACGGKRRRSRFGTRNSLRLRNRFFRPQRFTGAYAPLRPD